MRQQEDDLEWLIQRVEEGDFESKVRLERELEPRLVPIVRRVLERGTAHSSWERAILAAGRRLAAMAATMSTMCIT